MGSLPRLVLGASIAVLTVACTVSRNGILTDPVNQRTIPINVVVGRDSADVSGTDPVTGEKLAGRLLPDEEQRRPHSEFGGVAPPMGGGSGAGPGGTAPIGVGGTSPTTLHLVGSIKGDQGTRLRCAVVLLQRLRLTGEGVCRTVDGEGDVRYVLRF